MTLRFALAAALVLGACNTPSDPRPDERQPEPLLRVLTYNIHHGEGTDGVFDYQRLARVINELEPDVVALQEVDNKTRRAAGVDLRRTAFPRPVRPARRPRHFLRGGPGPARAAECRRVSRRGWCAACRD